MERREFLTSMCGLGAAALFPWAWFAEAGSTITIHDIMRARAILEDNDIKALGSYYSFAGSMYVFP